MLSIFRKVKFYKNMKLSLTNFFHNFVDQKLLQEVTFVVRGKQECLNNVKGWNFRQNLTTSGIFPSVR